MTWVLLFVAFSIAFVTLREYRGWRKHRDYTLARRNATTCPVCDAQIGELFATADAIALDRRREAIRNAPKDRRINPCGHPVELQCCQCECKLFFHLDDSVACDA